MTNRPDNEDKLLVSQLRDNKVKAYDRLFQKYTYRLYKFSYSLLKNDEDSKEIVQEVFYRIWKKRHEINPSKSFKSYLFTVSYNLIIDQLRIKLKDREYRKFLQNNLDKNTIKNNHLSDYDLINNKVKKAIEELPERRKQIYKLSREKGHSQKEIAEQLGINVKTVENQITLSLKYIKLKLGNEILP